MWRLLDARKCARIPAIFVLSVVLAPAANPDAAADGLISLPVECSNQALARRWYKKRNKFQ
jgi:hypothetical protein